MSALPDVAHYAKSVAKKAKSAAGPSTAATVALTAAGLEFTAHVYEHTAGAAGFGKEAAEKLGLKDEQVFKTLVCEVDSGLAVAVVPVSGTLDLKAMAKALDSKKADLADPAAAERKTGYVVGGISPIGQKTKLPTVIDRTANEYETIFVSGGRRGFDIELTSSDLAAITNAVFAPIGRPA